MSYIGDFILGATFDKKFTTVDSTGAPTTLAGSPVVSAYPDNSTTELTAGITLTVDFDSRTGMHNVRVVASSGNGYAAGVNYALVVTTGTVGGTSVVGYVIGEFSIQNRPTTGLATLAKTDVENAVWDANIVDGHGTTKTAGLSLSSIWQRALSAVTDIVTNSMAGFHMFDGVNAYDRTQDSNTGLRANGATAATVADAVWDELLSGHTTAGSAGAELTTAATTGDPWATMLPGSYTSGQAGNIVGNSLDVSVSSRLASSSITLNSGAVTVGTNNDKTGYRLSSTGVSDVWDAAVAEPSAVFSWSTGKFRDIVNWLGAVTSNRLLQTSTLETIRNRANSASIATAAVSDDGTTFIRASLS